MKDSLLSFKNHIPFVLVVMLGWKILLLLPEYLGKIFLAQRPGYVSEAYPWANFDGLHYLSIAKDGYFQYEYAFFPLFPIIIRHIEKFFRINYLESSIIIVAISLLATLLLLYKLSLLDINKRNARWVIFLFLAFPTSFFLTAIYSESLFLALSIGSFYAARKEKWVIAGILGGFASATRFVGILLFPALIIECFYQTKEKKNYLEKLKLLVKNAWGILLVPVGFVWYMLYLHNLIGDAFAFVHSQFAFGANRSSGEIILLPQVFFRYIKILYTIPPTNYDFWIAIFELIFFLLFLLYFLKRLKIIRPSYLFYSFFVVFVPTLSGTLSSEPRYILAAFPFFISLSTENVFIRYTLLILGILLESILATLFLRGYFVS